MTEPNVIKHLTRRELFGTQTRLAQAAGCKPHTISEKKLTNTLTHIQMRRILAVAPEMGVQITPADFFPELGPAAPSAKRKKAA